MTLAAGTRLGPYGIVSSLGAGGMGEVYRARDTRLQRDVAIKVLAGPVANRQDLKERFEREARTIAGLNHPHICVLHDIGHESPSTPPELQGHAEAGRRATGSGQAIDFLVMEYLEGETLAQRLRRGPLPLADVLRHGAEIGDALDKAHRKNVTHRDLKPGNVILTREGAKLLDFGLAKLRPTASDLSQQQTQDNPITAQGTILGTLHYMAPEQLEGKEADARSDVFALGAVLYEMATGKRAFDGQSQASLIASIMASDPPAMSAIQPMTPAALDRLVRRCLRKDPDARWQSVHDLTEELRWIAQSTPLASGSHASASLPAVAPPGRSRLRYAWAGGAIAVAVIALAAATRFMGGTAPVSVAAPVRFTVGPPERALFPSVESSGLYLSVSPDGTTLAFVVNDVSGRTQIWTRRLDATAATPLAGTEGGSNPFWSPDSRFVGFIAERGLKKVAVSGGPAQTVVAGPVVGSAAWNSAGTILFSQGAGALHRVSEAGGAAEPATELDAAANEVVHALPHFLPDGDHFLFLARSSNLEQTAIHVGSLTSRERRHVLAVASGAVFVQPGYVLFHRDGTLMAQRFDVRTLATTGEAVPVIENVQFLNTTRVAGFAASRTGVLAYRTASGAPSRTLVWVSRDGTEQPLPAPPRGYQQARVSPDGRRIAVQIEERDSQIWVYDIGREALTRLTLQRSNNQLAIWTPDGGRITYYSSDAGTEVSLFWQAADGSGASERLTTSGGLSHAPMSWSPDGRRLAFTENPGGADRDLLVLDLTDRKAAPFIKTSFTEGGAQFSPDGRWMAYTSDESGRAEVYVQPYPGPGGKWQVSTDGGAQPIWNRNGRELFYRTGDRMMAVPVTTEGAFSSGRPQMLFERRYVSIQLPQTFAVYDVSPDGQQFLMVKETEQVGAPIDVVLNWPALLTPGAQRGTN